MAISARTNQHSLQVDLTAAIEIDDVGALSAAIAAGADIEFLNHYGATPLCLAAACGSVKCIEALTSAGARINRQIGTDTPPIGSALIASIRHHKIDAAFLLLELGADPRVADCNWETAGHALLSEPDLFDDEPRFNQLLERLLDKGLPINQVNTKLQPMLSVALDYFAPSLTITLLLERGASVDLIDRDGKAPMHAIVEEFQVGYLPLLIAKGADVNSPCAQGRTALFYATDAETVQALLDLGADVHHRCNMGQTPLAYALMSKRGGPRLDAMVGLYLEAGARLDDPSCSGQTARDFLKSASGGPAERCRLVVGAFEARQAMRSAAAKAKPP